jgi:hypothetical protein
MDMNASVKLVKDMDVTDLSGEKVMVDFETGKYYLIKGVGNDIWDLIQQEITVGEIVSKLLVEYEVEEEECKTSVIEFLQKLRKSSLIH